MLLLQKARNGLHYNCLRPWSRLRSVRRSFHDEQGLVQVAPAVRLALEEGRPVVALESTIISHGMPYPENLTMARCVREEERERAFGRESRIEMFGLLYRVHSTNTHKAFPTYLVVPGSVVRTTKHIFTFKQRRCDQFSM